MERLTLIQFFRKSTVFEAVLFLFLRIFLYRIVILSFFCV